MPAPIGIVQVGLGPIGNRVTRALLENGAFRIVGAVDVDPAKRGLDVAELAGLPPIGTSISNHWEDLPAGSIQAAVITTLSSLQATAPQVLEAVDRGLHVVSTCEELAYPWLTQPQLAQKIDAAARSRGVAVLGTGINPGFLMDFLAVAASAVCLEVRKVTVERIFDAARRRRPFQQKVGVGLTVEEFQRQVAEKRLRHVGLTESMHMIAQRLGWQLDSTEDRIEAVIATRPIALERGTLARGKVAGVVQRASGRMGGREVISLLFRAAAGESASYDRVCLDSRPPIDLRIQGGVNGDEGTVAITVNSIATVVEAAPGLRTMADIPPVTCFNAGRGIWGE